MKIIHIIFMIYSYNNLLSSCNKYMMIINSFNNIIPTPCWIAAPPVLSGSGMPNRWLLGHVRSCNFRIYTMIEMSLVKLNKKYWENLPVEHIVEFSPSGQLHVAG